MSVSISTHTVRTISFCLGSITLCEETGNVSFYEIQDTGNYGKVRELAKVLEDVAVMMEVYGGSNGALK